MSRLHWKQWASTRIGGTTAPTRLAESSTQGRQVSGTTGSPLTARQRSLSTPAVEPLPVRHGLAVGSSLGPWVRPSVANKSWFSREQVRALDESPLTRAPSASETRPEAGGSPLTCASSLKTGPVQGAGIHGPASSESGTLSVIEVASLATTGDATPEQAARGRSRAFNRDTRHSDVQYFHSKNRVCHSSPP